MKIRWRNVFVAPRAELVGDGLVKVHGLICDAVCAVRVRESLRTLPLTASVERVSDDTFRVTSAAPLTEGQLDRAVQRVVVLRPLRRLLGRFARARD